MIFIVKYNWYHFALTESFTYFRSYAYEKFLQNNHTFLEYTSHSYNTGQTQSVAESKYRQIK